MLIRYWNQWNSFKINQRLNIQKQYQCGSIAIQILCKRSSVVCDSSDNDKWGIDEETVEWLNKNQVKKTEHF